MDSLRFELNNVWHYLRECSMHAYANSISKAINRLATQDKRIAELEAAALKFYDAWSNGSVDDECEAARVLAALLPGRGE